MVGPTSSSTDDQSKTKIFRAARPAPRARLMQLRQRPRRLRAGSRARCRNQQSRHQRIIEEERPMEYVYVGRNELVALVVGLMTGTIYSYLNLPIPAPNVLGGILAIIF